MARTEVRNSRKRLVDAIAADDIGAVQRAVDGGARVSGGMLIYAIVVGSDASTKWLLEAGANPNAVGNDLYEDFGEDTALCVATGRGRESIVRMLIHAGAHVDRPGDGGCSPLILATRHDYWECLEHLIEAGANVNHTCSDGQTALIQAAYRGSIECVRFLLQAEAEVNVVDGSGCTALMAACSSRFGKWLQLAMTRREIVEMLLHAGAEVNRRDKYCDTALIVACGDTLYDRVPGEWNVQETTAVVEILVSAGSDVNVANSLGVTPLMKVCRDQECEGYEMAIILLDAGADINAVDGLSCTALMYAARYSNLRMVDVLLNRGADVNMRNCDGKSAIELIALVREDAFVGKALIIAGADVRDVDLGSNAMLCEARERYNELRTNLKHQCRETIRTAIMRQNMGKRLDRLVEKLPLPVILREYIADVSRYEMCEMVVSGV